DQLARLARLRAERDGADDIDFSLTMTLSVAPAQIATVRRDQLQLFRSRQNTVRGEAEQIEQRIAQFDEEIRGLQAQKKSRQTQLGFLKDELEGLRDLYNQGLVPKRRMLALERQFAETEGESGQFTSDMARARGRIAELRVQAAQSKRERTNQILTELRVVEASVAELLERRTAAQNRLSRVDIHAPRDGFVHNLSVHTIGGVISPRDPIMAIIPEKDALELEARVDPNDIHRIYREQKVIIRFSSLDAARTPELDGTVTRIPAAATQQANGQRPPEYIVRIGFADGEFDKLDGQSLKPGMPAEVYIETGDRKAISFLLKPMLDALPTVFRGE
ncbi:MAG: HlyD family type I secretion periplasmic adaptor subunit, partial [Pseudomonadota bacterium]